MGTLAGQDLRTLKTTKLSVHGENITVQSTEPLATYVMRALSFLSPHDPHEVGTILVPHFQARDCRTDSMKSCHLPSAHPALR